MTDQEVHRSSIGVSYHEIDCGGRLVLAIMTPADAEDIFSLIDSGRNHLSQHGDETAGKYLSVQSVLDSIITPRNPNKYRYTIRNRENDLVGSINLTPDEKIDHKAEIGYYLGSQHTGNGYMTEAVRVLTDYAISKLGFTTLVGYVHQDNNPSMKVLKRSGYAFTKQKKNKLMFTHSNS